MNLGSMQTLFPVLYLGMFFLIFYFLLIRPQQKKNKELKLTREKVQVGDYIVTIGGIKGKIVKSKDDELTIETGEEKSSSLIIKRWAVGGLEGKKAPAKKA